MNKRLMCSRGSLSFGLVLLFALGVAGTSLSDEAFAQIRPAYVKNVDEPGLAPFSQTFFVSQSNCGCTNCCFLATAAVPAGKRLVIKSVSGWVPQESAGSLGYIHLSQADASSSEIIATILPVFRQQWNGGTYPAWEFHQTMLAFVDPGKQAKISLFGWPGWGFQTGVVTINGYFVSLP